MADLKISQLASLDQAELATTDAVPVVDTSGTQTKKITPTALIAGAIDLLTDGTIDGNKIEIGTTSARGTLQLTNSTSSTSTTTAATPAAVKTANDTAVAAQATASAALPKAGGTMTGVIVFDATQTKASLSAYGITKLSDATGSADSTLAATSNAVKTAKDTADAARSVADAALPKTGGTMTGAIVFDATQQKASTSTYGITQLTDSAASTSTSTAATPAAVKVAKDAADAAQATANTGVTNAATAQATANAALPKAGGIITGNVDNSSTGYFDLPAGTTAQRPGSPNSGWVRFNTDTGQYEGYTGSLWSSIGGGAKGGGADAVFFENDQTITTNYTLTTNKNAVTAGPVTINSGVTVTVPSGSSWVVV